jgi:hypothetical protein
VILLGVAAALTLAIVLLWRDLFASASSVQEVPRGDQEIAWIDSATTGTNWERLVAAVGYVRTVARSWPDLEVDAHQAFPDRSFDTPQIALSVPGSKARLWIRWYKVTSRTSASDWITELARRDPAPLAIIGGANSADAIQLARALAAKDGAWHGAAPLLLITNATAETVSTAPDAEGQKLMELYPGRSFRFCFKNSQMATAVLDFIWEGPANLGKPPVIRLEWKDDPYSRDLSRHFGKHWECIPIAYSVGEYYRPNPSEAQAIQALLAHLAESAKRPLLILPTGTQQARRFLQALAATAPHTRQAVVATGDSISLNSVYRDRDFAWNIQDVPMPLVFFSHHNPIDWSALAPNAGLVGKLVLALAPRHASPWLTSVPTPADYGMTNATDPLLLNVSIIDKTLTAAFPRGGGRRQLVADADALRAGLRNSRVDDTTIPFFDQDGNRRERTGEYIVCLRPHLAGERVLPVATLEVWFTKPEGVPAGPRAWSHQGSLLIDYGASFSEGGSTYALP